MSLKQIITAVLTVFIPLIYEWFTSKFPDFPLTGDQVFTVFIWVVNSIVFGANSLAMWISHKLSKGEPVTVGKVQLSK